MLYLDSGCLLKLYYPEANSSQITAAVVGEVLCLNALHELELTTGLQAKVFRGEATPAQVSAAWTALESDVAVGKLRRVVCAWPEALYAARELAARYSAGSGCRALDTLHCALAQQSQLEMVTTDARQIALAQAAGIAVRTL